MIKYTKVETCLVCDQNHAKELFYFQSKDDQWYHALKCRNCGLVFASPQPLLNRESINEIYSSDYYKNYYGSGQDYQDKELTDFFMRCYEKEYGIYEGFIAKKSGRRVLDVGCGDGKFLEIFKRHGWECMGLEPSEASRKIAIEKGFQVIDVPFVEMGSNYGSFDMIFLDNVIEHINESKPFLNKAYSLLDKKGIFVLKTPNSNSLHEWLETFMLRALPNKWNESLWRAIKKYFNQGSGRVHRFGNLHPPVHLAIYNDKSMTTALMKAGFLKEKIRHFHVSPNHPKWTVKAVQKGFYHNAKKMIDHISNLLNKGEYLVTIAEKD